MTKTEAIHSWFNAFMPSFREGNVDEDAKMPWLTYSWAESGRPFEAVNITVNIWHKTESEKICDDKADAFKQYIAENDIIVYDGGAIMVTPGTPFCQSLNDETDSTLKRRYINLELEYLNF